MTKRAGIYIRVSSERQGDKISPEAQENDCKAYCQQHGYQVVEVYRDVEKYRSGKRLVEPSGTRADRPGLVRLLSDVRAEKLDVIIAWREDRLYRSYRPMLDVLDCLEDTKIDIELVKERFDKHFAPIKAWAARMELDARSDRITMGIAGRFASGRVWPTSLPYGYRKSEKGMAELEPVESLWVKRIWEWHAEGVTGAEMRRRLIEGGAPQRTGGRIPWQTPFIYGILKKQVYHTGFQAIKWGDKVYEIQYPVIVDPETAQRVAARKTKSKEIPVRHLKHNYLGLNLVHCAACGNRMGARTMRYYAKEKKKYRINSEYRCGNFSQGYDMPNCTKTIHVHKLDSLLWGKVWSILNNDADFDAGIQERIEQLRREQTDSKEDVEQIQRELASIPMERQWVINQARKRTINQEDMETQLAQLTIHEKELKRELAGKSILVDDRADRLIEFANEYRTKLRSTLEWLNEPPRSEEDAEKQFKARRHIVEMIVRRVDILQDKSIKVYFEFDLTNEIKEAPVWWR